MTDSEWHLSGRRDEVSITADWSPANRELIDGVSITEVRNVPAGYGYLTEVYRTDWGLEPAHVDQVFQSVLVPGGLSAWHAHGESTDRLFAASGLMLVVLHDARPDSPTRGLTNVFRLGIVRPGLVVIPPRVWHGVKNVAAESASLLNLVDRAYRYEGPDHYRLAPDSREIPFDILAAR
jgi:dTDP-4-dehydrorhamnose 3,5-epimerase